MKYRIADVKTVLEKKDFEIFCHGANLKGAFASGIAGVVRSVYPACYALYIDGVISDEYEGGQMIPYEIIEYGADKDGYCWDSFEDYLVTNPNKEISNRAIELVKDLPEMSYEHFERELRMDFPNEEKIFFNKEKTPNKIILNAFTQILPGPNGSYDLVDKVFKTISKVYDAKISFPLIGCGIAGLEWNIVKEIIDYRLKGKDYECIVRMQDVEKYGLLNNYNELQ
jgi:hypothetical protein